MPPIPSLRRSYFIFFALVAGSQLFAQNEPFSMRVVANRFSFPYEIVYGPDNNIWTTERTGGKVTLVNPSTGVKTTLLTLGNKMVQSAGQDGLFGIAIHPQFLSGKPYVYIAYTYQSVNATRRLTKIERYVYTVVHNKPVLNSPVTVIDNLPGSNDHNSGRLSIGPDNKLYYTIGDMGAGQFDNLARPNNAQDLNIYEGKILRFNLETIIGSWIPIDNPFTNGSGNRTAVYTYGHRNAQGLAWGNVNGSWRLYSCEHGPYSDDEVNLLESGRNYGWPKVGGYCDGNYNGRRLGGQLVVSEQDNCTALNVSEPLATMYSVSNPPDSTTNNLTWPSVAPSGMDFYNSTAIPGWQSSLLIAGLKSGTLIRFKLSTDGLTVLSDTIMYFRGKGRFRDVCISPDGKKIYISTDNTGSTSGPTGGVTTTPANPGSILEFTYTGTPGARSISETVEETRTGIIVYPNPANNLLTINANGTAIRFYELIAIGSGIIERSNITSGTTYIPVSKISPGIYILKLYGSKGEVLDVRKITIVH